MSKIDRNIDAYDRLMLRTSQLKECQAELTALRAWKAKARVILRHEYTVLKFNADMFEENQPEQDKKKLAILTHLLGDK